MKGKSPFYGLWRNLWLSAVVVLVGISILAGLEGCGGSSGGGDSDPAASDVEEVTTETESVSYDVSLPQGAALKRDDLKVSSFSSDEAEIVKGKNPAVLMADDASGNTILLGYAIPSELRSQTVGGANSIVGTNSVGGDFALDRVELSIRSTALSLVMMSMGSVADRAAKLELMENVLKHGDFADLQASMETEWKRDGAFLEKIKTFPDITAKIKSIAKAVFDAYLAKVNAERESGAASGGFRAASRNSSSQAVEGREETFWWGSPWDREEPWIWYGTANFINVIGDPFLAVSKKGGVSAARKYAAGNPANVSYMLDIHAANDDFLDWRFVDRNSTLIQKGKNSGAALTYLQEEIDFAIDPSSTYIFKIKKCWLSDFDKARYWGVRGVHLLHIVTGVANIVADGSVFELFAGALSKKAALAEASQEIASLASSINLADPFSASNLKSVVETVRNILGSSAINQIVKKHAKKELKKKTAGIVKKIAIKLTAKLSHPAGWAMMVVEAVNDFVPLTASLLGAPSEVVYTANFGSGSVIKGGEKKPAPIVLVLAAPENGAKVANGSVDFRWSGNAVSYDLYIGERPKTMTKRNESPLEETGFRLSGLEGGSVRFWKVVATNGSGRKKESPVYRFTVAGRASDAPPLSEIVGIWAGSERHGDKTDLWYLAVNPDGTYYEYDWRGDTYENGAECYAKTGARYTDLGGGSYRYVEDSGRSGTVGISIANDRLTTTENGKTYVYQPSGKNEADFAPLCPSGPTYSWVAGEWGACTNGTQSRTVVCKSSDGATVADSHCSGTKPATTQTCSTGGSKGKLSDTGQTKCYDGSGSEIACPSPGNPLAQDGSYTIHPPSFTDNGNGTVTDNNTGLIWQQEDDNTGRYHSDAVSYCRTTLKLAGKIGWRLPNIQELESIVDYGKPAPAIDATYFPGTDSLNYWSSTSDANDTSYAWRVRFYDGNAVSSHGRSYDYRVRCVWGGQ